MSEHEKPSVFRIVRNSVTCAAIASAPAFAGNVENVSAAALETINYRPTITRQLTTEKPKTKLFDQLDEFVETKHGRALASAALVFAIAQGLYNMQQSLERDKKRKVTEAAAASGLFLSLSSVLFAQSFTDIDPRVPASLLSAFSLFQSAYNVESTLERDKPLRKRASNVIASGALITASSTILAETLK